MGIDVVGVGHVVLKVSEMEPALAFTATPSGCGKSLVVTSVTG